jgi:hypothetical protein
MQANRADAVRVTRPRNADQVQAIIVQSMADAGYDPAFVYVFEKEAATFAIRTRTASPKNSIEAFDVAVNECCASIAGRAQ